jgi:transcriptional regulator NrdR family protein
MKCPVCGTYTEVIDSRMRPDGTRRRRYLCANMHRFTTLELILPEKHHDRLPTPLGTR